MKISDNVALLALPRPMPPGAPENDAKINLVLTWDDENLVLIDAGFPEQADLIKQAIAEHGFDAKNLTHIIITHQDLDHIGCIKDLQQIAPNVQIMAHCEEAPYLDGRKVPVKLAPIIENYENLPPEHKQGVDQAKQIYEQLQTNYTELQGGQILTICGGIKVIHTPGHTPGHIVLLLQKSQILVCGDAANIEDGQMTGPNPVYTADMDMALQSLEKIKACPKIGFVAYHGGFLKSN